MERDLGAQLARMISVRSSLADLRARDAAAADAAVRRAVTDAAAALGCEAGEVEGWLAVPPWLVNADAVSGAAAAYERLAAILADA